MHEDIRWKQRYSNYRGMLNALNRNLQHDDIPSEFVESIQIAIGKSFELCFELMWKLLKDYLEHEDIDIGLISPRNVLKAAANAGLLQRIGVDGNILMQALKIRNELAHIYDQEKLCIALEGVREVFFPEMLKIGNYFGKLADADD